VFEYLVKKSLYKEDGICFHRFHAPRGIVGADTFGAAKPSHKKIKNKHALS